MDLAFVALGLKIASPGSYICVVLDAGVGVVIGAVHCWGRKRLGVWEGGKATNFGECAGGFLVWEWEAPTVLKWNTLTPFNYVGPSLQHTHMWMYGAWVKRMIEHLDWLMWGRDGKGVGRDVLSDICFAQLCVRGRTDRRPTGRWTTDPDAKSYFTLRYFTLLYFTLLDFILLYSTIFYSTLLYSTLLYFTSLYSTLLCFTILSFTLLYSTLL